MRSRRLNSEKAAADTLHETVESRIEVVVALDLHRLLRTTRDLNVLIDAGVKVISMDGEPNLHCRRRIRATLLASIARFEVRPKGERRNNNGNTRNTGSGAHDLAL